MIAQALSIGESVCIYVTLNYTEMLYLLVLTYAKEGASYKGSCYMSQY